MLVEVPQEMVLMEKASWWRAPGCGLPGGVGGFVLVDLQDLKDHLAHKNL